MVMNNGTERRAAVEAWREATAAGERLSGAQLAKRFNRSERWGRDRIAEARNDDADNGDHVTTAIPDRAKRPEIGERQPDAPPTTPAARHQADQGPDSNGGAAPTAQRPVGVVAADAPATRPWQDTMITAVVALVAAAASYLHMYDMALMAGEPVWIARAFPIAVDGLVLAALRRGDRGRPWLVLGLGVSVAANIAAQFPELAAEAGPAVSAWPPIALYGTHRLLSRGR